MRSPVPVLVPVREMRWFPRLALRDAVRHRQPARTPPSSSGASPLAAPAATNTTTARLTC